MNREEVKGDYKPDISVQLTNKEGKPGAFLIGKLMKAPKLVEKVGRFKKDKHIYPLALVDTNAPTQILKDEKYVEAEVGTGDPVVLWVPVGGALDRKLSKFTVGETVEIQYMGKSENPETGNSSHQYKVFRVQE